MKTGFLVGSILSMILGAIYFVRHLVSPRPQETMLEILEFTILIFVIEAVVFLPLLFAVIFLVFGAVIKPICMLSFAASNAMSENMVRQRRDRGAPRRLGAPKYT